MYCGPVEDGYTVWFCETPCAADHPAFTRGYENLRRNQGTLSDGAK